ncbi:13163_t:CDS:2 [Funneliformis caledonium]|uniref:13163_t:CDS:1 n=1 Tax=Funneliformis caledonium TaxID=1117310 RepID=A0A9N9AN57_9GLOM|nr:13163_t:CDS:2 [Funneliformis caledonium]
MSTPLDIDNVSRWTLDGFKFLQKLFGEKYIIGYHFDPDTSPSTSVLPKRFNLSFDYVLSLLSNSSRDGFDAKKFHELCDNKGSTIMISKLKENAKLFGRYNPLNWRPYDGIKDLTRRDKWSGDLHDSFYFLLQVNNILIQGTLH